MGATVVPAGRHSTLAWCEEHQDGVRTPSKKKAHQWADQHNSAEHGETVA